jgi:hypothetical protein
LRELRGKAPIQHLAEQTGYSRYQIGRWLSGKTEPKLPEFIALVEAASRRALDLLAEVVDPAQLASVAPAWKQMVRAREAAYASPLSHAVLRALELEGSRKVRAESQVHWLCQHLGVDAEQVEDGLRVLRASGQIRKQRGRYRPHRVLTVETSREPERARMLKASWFKHALARFEAGAPGFHGYSLFAVARKDLLRLRELEQQYVRAMQSVIASSNPAECVGLYCVHLLDLSTVDNALS